MIGRMTRVGAGIMLLPLAVGLAALGGAAVGAAGVFAAQRMKRRGGDGFGGGARQTDGEDASASFAAGIADENTVPGRAGMPIAPM